MVRLAQTNRATSLMAYAMTAAFAPLLVAVLPDRAEAMPAIHICSDLDTNFAGTPMDFSSDGLDLTVLTHDRITVTNSTGVVRYTPPGGSLTEVGSPALLDVGTGQSGHWFVNTPVAGGTTVVACTIGGAHVVDPKHRHEDKAGATRALQNALNSVTPGLIDDLGLGAGAANGSRNTGAVIFAPIDRRLRGVAPRFPDTMELESAVAGFKDRMAGPGGWEADGFGFTADLMALAGEARDVSGKGDAPAWAAAYGNGRDSDPEAFSPRPLVSVSGRYVDFDDDQDVADRKGHMWQIVSTFGYQFTPSLAAGVVLRRRDGEVWSDTLAARLESRNFGLGTYLAYIAPGGMRVTAAGLYEAGNNDIRFTGSTGNFESETVTLEGRVDRRYRRKAHWIEPNVSLLYVHMDNDDFVDDTGTRVAGFSEELGRITFGPKIGTEIATAGGTAYRPFVKIEGVWDFIHADDLTSPSGEVLKNGGAAVNLGGGIEAQHAGGLLLTLEGEWFGYDTALRGWSVSGGLGTLLATFGVGDIFPGGVAALNFSAGERDQGKAEATVNIPLGANRGGAPQAR